MNEIKNQLRVLIVQALHLSQDPASIPDENLTTTLGLDSINSLELLIWVENHFRISIEDEDLSVALVDSLDVLAAYIEMKLSAAAGQAEGTPVGAQA
jgi:acyl carrier protein